MNDVVRQTFERAISGNPYPGRGLVIGRNAAGEWTLIYWIMGRSEHSRNRQFVAEGSVLRTRAFDPSKVVDPSLIIYEAMLELPGLQLVSNGDQTRTLYEWLSRGSNVEAALEARAHEPDAPHYTPRISGVLDLRGSTPRVCLSILRANPTDPALTDRTFFHVAAPAPGTARGITTYAGDGNPLRSFSGEPLLLPCDGTGAELLDRYFEALDADNRISVAVKTVAADGRCKQLLVRNRYA
jgi:IMP cyclohydrolase